MQINTLNKQFLKRFFELHDVYFCDSLPWQFFNYENGKLHKQSNIITRLDWLFSKFGFFKETYKEKDVEYLKNAKREDRSFYHRQRRYLVQEFIDNDGVFYNPTHHTIRPKNKDVQLSINDVKTMRGFQLITHPGNTRFAASCYLQDNLPKTILYVNKKFNYKPPIGLQKIDDIQDLNGLWKPHYLFRDQMDNLEYQFFYEGSETDNPSYKNGTKYHQKTGSNVLKLWGLKLKNKITDYEKFGPQKILARGLDDLLHSSANNYIASAFDSSKDIGVIIGEKPLTIYTNSNIDVKSYFLNIRNKLINLSNEMNLKIIKKNKDNQRGAPMLELKYFIDEDVLNKHFTFDVKVVDSKPNNIPKLNDYKGFAIWIDKDRINDITREIYELLFYTRRDVKIAETKDGKVSVINCRKKVSDFNYFGGVKDIPLLKWIIKDSFLKCDGLNISIDNEYLKERNQVFDLLERELQDG